MGANQSSAGSLLELRHVGLALHALTEHGQPVVFHNTAFSQITGFSHGGKALQGLASLKAPRTDEWAAESINKAFSQQEKWSGVVQLRSLSGPDYWSYVVLNPVGKGRGVTHMLSVHFPIDSHGRIGNLNSVSKVPEPGPGLAPVPATATAGDGAGSARRMSGGHWMSTSGGHIDREFDLEDVQPVAVAEDAERPLKRPNSGGGAPGGAAKRPQSSTPDCGAETSLIATWHGDEPYVEPHTAERLKKIAKRGRDLFHGSGVAVVDSSAGGGGIMFANPKLHAILKCAPESLVGADVAAILHPVMNPGSLVTTYRESVAAWRPFDAPAFPHIGEQCSKGYDVRKHSPVNVGVYPLGDRGSNGDPAYLAVIVTEMNNRTAAAIGAGLLYEKRCQEGSEAAASAVVTPGAFAPLPRAAMAGAGAEAGGSGEGPGAGGGAGDALYHAEVPLPPNSKVIATRSESLERRASVGRPSAGASGRHAPPLEPPPSTDLVNIVDEGDDLCLADDAMLMALAGEFGAHAPSPPLVRRSSAPALESVPSPRPSPPASCVLGLSAAVVKLSCEDFEEGGLGDDGSTGSEGDRWSPPPTGDGEARRPSPPLQPRPPEGDIRPMRPPSLPASGGGSFRRTRLSGMPSM